MHRRLPPILILLFLLGLTAPTALAAPTTPTPDEPEATTALSSGQLNITQVVSGLASPLGVVNAGDGTNRLFVVEQRGTVRVVNSNGTLQSGYFLDIRNVSGGITSGGERGLLGLAFHPNFESNRKLFVYYTNGGGDIVIAEMTANSARTSASTSTVDPIFSSSIEHSANTNHNGGQLLFGPDGYLYIFVGDGGGQGDPGENAQDNTERLGKILRVDPDLSGGADIPSSNPYVGPGGGSDVVWAIGLRNPWRASFDRDTDRLWVADVGQGSWEEINRVDDTPGLNFGWDECEGTHIYEGPGPCTSGGMTGPIAQYGHSGGNCSVTGGYVYRGDIFPDLVGQYVLGDYCSGQIWTIAASGSPTLVARRNTSATITSFGEAENGELYMTDLGGGRLYRVVAPPFTDIVNSQFINHITWLAGEGITAGCSATRYCPDGLVTRGQMATFLVRALGLPATGTDFFTDDNGSVHENNINRLRAAGITAGCGGSRFCPDGLVTRAQMATFMVRAYDLPASGTNYFTDDGGLVHEPNINALRASGITAGCGGTNYCPSGIVTRGQMAAFLYRAEH